MPATNGHLLAAPLDSINGLIIAPFRVAYLSARWIAHRSRWPPPNSSSAFLPLQLATVGEIDEPFVDSLPAHIDFVCNFAGSHVRCVVAVEQRKEFAVFDFFRTRHDYVFTHAFVAQEQKTYAPTLRYL